MIIFQNPIYLTLFLVLPLIVFFHIISIRSTKKRAIKFANFKAISNIRGVELFSKNLISLYFYMFIICMIILSLSGISWVTTVEASDVPIVIALDVSRSMSADDVSPSRLEGAKESLNNFLDSLSEGSEVGLIVFSSAPHIKNEVTDELDEIKSSLEGVEIADFGGTDILNSVRAGAAAMYPKGGGSLILVSDGRANVNSVQEVVNYANTREIIVHTLSVGTAEGGDGRLGEEYKASKESLKYIAEETKGNYFDIFDESDFSDSFQEIMETSQKKVTIELYPYLLILSLILLLVFYIVYNSRYRMLP